MRCVNGEVLKRGAVDWHQTVVHDTCISKCPRRRACAEVETVRLRGKVVSKVRGFEERVPQRRA